MGEMLHDDEERTDIIAENVGFRRSVQDQWWALRFHLFLPKVWDGEK